MTTTSPRQVRDPRHPRACVGAERASNTHRRPADSERLSRESHTRVTCDDHESIDVVYQLVGYRSWTRARGLRKVIRSIGTGLTTQGGPRTMTAPSALETAVN